MYIEKNNVYKHSKRLKYTVIGPLYCYAIGFKKFILTKTTQKTLPTAE